MCLRRAPCQAHTQSLLTPETVSRVAHREVYGSIEEWPHRWEMDDPMVTAATIPRVVPNDSNFFMGATTRVPVDVAQGLAGVLRQVGWDVDMQVVDRGGTGWNCGPPRSRIVWTRCASLHVRAPVGARSHGECHVAEGARDEWEETNTTAHQRAGRYGTRGERYGGSLTTDGLNECSNPCLVPREMSSSRQGCR